MFAEAVMLQRLTIHLSPLEQQALQAVAARELRDLSGQARFILRQELERRGLLTAESEAARRPAEEQRHPEARAGGSGDGS